MAVEHHDEFALLDDAVIARDVHVRARWDREFRAWVAGDHSGPCPFQTVASKARESAFFSCSTLVMLTILQGRLLRTCRST
jgi:hypothetical protein